MVFGSDNDALAVYGFVKRPDSGSVYPIVVG
jgi:hypothetical protein